MTAEPGAAFVCQICGMGALWSLLRHGDVVRSWACSPHLLEVIELLQRVDEETEITVKYRWLAAVPVEPTP